MKKLVILLSALVLLASCKETQDTRFFAPEVEFATESITVRAESGGADVRLLFSRPAPMAFSIGLHFDGVLQEGVQFTADHSISVPEGAQEASVHVTLVDDEIWDEVTWLVISIDPGNRYTVNPHGCCVTRVNVTKEAVLPVLSLRPEEGDLEINPYRPHPVKLSIQATLAPRADVNVQLDLGELVPGRDCLVNGEARGELTLPAGESSLSFTLDILQKDQSGYDKTVAVTMTPVKGSYGVSSDATVNFHLWDPVVNFKPLWNTTAQVGEGFQVRQAFKQADGGWNGNLAANWTVSAEGSNYLKSLKNMETGTFGCPSNTVGLHILRLAEFIPKLRTTSGDAIADYGNNSNTRGFSAVDSLFRFVLDPGSTTQGDLVLNKPRTFTAFTGDYTAWQAAWKDDSKATGGDIFQSASPILTGRVEVTLVRLEGRFDLSSKDEPLLFTAWFSCDHPQFMEGVDLEKIAAVREDGLWKVEYKLWPR